MKSQAQLDQNSFYGIIRQVMDACADCDTCRFLMDETCFFFQELYRLFDREKEIGSPPSPKELQGLADKCTLCGLCPCPDIRANIVNAKAARVRQQGMPPGIRLLADLQGVCRWTARFPGVANTLKDLPLLSDAAKRALGITRHRELPAFAAEDFFTWADRKGLTRKPDKSPGAAYFAGCTAAYLFPEVARAAVFVLEQNGISVHVPPQQCCGMPTLVEGEAQITRRRVCKNLHNLLDAAAPGCDLVCSCPTCGFFMKVLLKQGAFYSDAYQQSVNAEADEIRIPEARGDKSGHFSLQKSVYGSLLKDNPYFSDIDPMARISLSEKISDMGQYLEKLHKQGRLDTNLGPVKGRIVYFAACHQREQNMGSPYEKLLKLVPGLDLKRAGGAMDCCGMGGSLGYKENFHQDSVRLAQPLVRKIRDAHPEAIVTDCLSCRLQFRHLMPDLAVFHPLEILKKAYEKKNRNLRHAKQGPQATDQQGGQK